MLYRNDPDRALTALCSSQLVFETLLVRVLLSLVCLHSRSAQPLRKRARFIGKPWRHTPLSVCAVVRASAVARTSCNAGDGYRQHETAWE